MALSLSFATAGLAALVTSSTPGTQERRGEIWSLPADARVTEVRPEVRKGYEGDSIVPMCGDFSLTERQVRTFLRHARTITERQLHDHYDWLPCVVAAKLESSHEAARVEISATLVAYVNLADGRRYVLACDGECEKAVARVGAESGSRR
jgi:hypothetical protein